MQLCICFCTTIIHSWLTTQFKPTSTTYFSHRYIRVWDAELEHWWWWAWRTNVAEKNLWNLWSLNCKLNKGKVVYYFWNDQSKKKHEPPEKQSNSENSCTKCVSNRIQWKIVFLCRLRSRMHHGMDVARSEEEKNASTEWYSKRIKNGSRVSELHSLRCAK